MHRKTTTIRDVAQQAGVSISRVSHVLNGNDWHVSSVVRQRVLGVVEQLNYRPNAIARSMVKRKTATIGLVINEVENPLFVPVVGGVNEVLQPAGYHMVLASAPDLEGEIEEGQERPTALFVANDIMAVGALKALHQAGVRVPQDMAIITIGDPPFAAYTVPAPTTLALPVLEAGGLAARILLNWFKEGMPTQAQHITLKFTLKVRESCGANLSIPG